MFNGKRQSFGSLCLPIFFLSVSSLDHNHKNQAQQSRETDWWDKINVTLRNLWLGLAGRLGIRGGGLHKLRHDVKTCEYEDVRVMWEMLNKTEIEMAGSPAKKRKIYFWSIFMVPNRVPYHVLHTLNSLLFF